MKVQNRTMNKSRQREAIMCYLKAHTNHPTAETIYNELRKDFPHISLGTVYRNLTLLVELGVIQKLSYGGASDRFDGNAMKHSHFVCNVCGNIFDIKLENIDFINTMAAKDFDGQIDGHNIFFYGKCKLCSEQ